MIALLCSLATCTVALELGLVFQLKVHVSSSFLCPCRVSPKMFFYLWKYCLCYCLLLLLQVLDSSQKLLPPDELRKRFEQEGKYFIHIGCKYFIPADTASIARRTFYCMLHPYSGNILFYVCLGVIIFLTHPTKLIWLLAYTKKLYETLASYVKLH